MDDEGKMKEGWWRKMDDEGKMKKDGWWRKDEGRGVVGGKTKF